MVELLVVIVIIGAVAALLIPAIAKAVRNARMTTCLNNLVQLWKMQHNYMVQFGAGEMPLETGGAFWTKLTQTTPPMIDASGKDIFTCQLISTPLPYGQTNYMGPGSNVNQEGAYGDADPVGCDKAANHSAEDGYNVLRKSGDVQTVGSTDPLWLSAQAKCIP
jgi:type II secretory pathway pseudopilin PulG